jgi:glycerol kinase
VWQDRRTAEACAALKARGEEAAVRAKTGLVLDPYFSATKLAWLLDHVDGARGRAAAGDLCFGTIDTWLVWRFTAGAAHVTDASNASRTLLYDIHAGAWDDGLCALFGIPKAVLPEVKSSAEVYGITKDCGVLPDGIPVCGMAGDQQSALFGQACFQPGESKCTYGTGAFLLRGRASSPVPRCSGCGMVWASSARRARWRTSPARCRTPAAAPSSRRWPGWAPRSGGRRPGGC